MTNSSRLRIIAATGLALTGTLAFSAVAVAERDSAQAGGGVVACYSAQTGNLRVVSIDGTKVGRGCKASNRVLLNQEGLQGPEGPEGPRGPAGPAASGVRGPAGPAGAQGQRGLPGQNGTDGVDGEDGAPGLNGIDGEDGIDGIDGIDGEDGIDGIDGEDGIDGIDGEDGTDGMPGLMGLPGLDGVDGEDGQDGVDGEDGVDGAPGAPGAQGIQGIPGPPGTQDLFGQDTSMAADGRGGWECPLGTVFLTAGSVSGGTPARGQILSINQNTALYSLLGNNYGGNYPQTFALPDLRKAAPNGLTYSICTVGLYPSRA